MSQARKHYPKGFVEIGGVLFPLSPRAQQRRLSSARSQNTGFGPRALVTMVLVGTGIFFAFPFIFSATYGNKRDPSQPLPGSALRRGAYMNWGSKDVGPDIEYYKLQKELRERAAQEEK
eukprot:TRINITY_DN686_c0_g1_i7.p5 TRINITY_DN686_c0_g1~~TRINITY_DN686_c0_g1_i7.p5  ORF type:complete len:119 (-),score=13.61 TRINITY_DN686_c0_g1_i7:1014-1370(-)